MADNVAPQQIVMPPETMTVGIDPSSKSTAMVVQTADGQWCDTLIRTDRPRKEAPMKDPGRLEYIRDQAIRFVSSCGDKEWTEAGRPVLLCIESPATQRGYAVINQALHWCLRQAFGVWFCTYTLVVAPNSLRKFITGNGHAEKGTCGARAQAMWGFIIETLDNGDQEDVLDALGLAQIADCWRQHGEAERVATVLWHQYQKLVALGTEIKPRPVFMDTESVEDAMRTEIKLPDGLFAYVELPASDPADTTDE